MLVQYPNVILPSDEDDPVADGEGEEGPLDGRPRAGGGDGEEGGGGQRHVQQHEGAVHGHAHRDPGLVHAVAQLQGAQADGGQGDGEQGDPT